MIGNGSKVKKRFCVLPKKIGGKWVWLRWYNKTTTWHSIVVGGKHTNYKQERYELIKD